MAYLTTTFARYATLAVMISYLSRKIPLPKNGMDSRALSLRKKSPLPRERWKVGMGDQPKSFSSARLALRALRVM